MPVINFDPRFEVAIREGWKTQTIRSPRVRPILPGDILTLLTGQRTPECRRICHDVCCTDVLSIEITFGDDGCIVIDGVPVNDLDDFAVRDGFSDSDDMATFFKRMHGPLEMFHGFVIEWSMPTGRAAQAEWEDAA